MWRMPTQEEQIAVWEMIERAVAERRPVTLAFFREEKDERGRVRRFKDGTPFEDGRPYLRVEHGRMVEPREGPVVTAAGKLLLRAPDRSPRGSELPGMRSFRLDRVAVRVNPATGEARPCVRLGRRDGWMIPDAYVTA